MRGTETASPIVIERIVVLDFYDGPVTALVWERSNGPWLAFLLGTTRLEGGRSRIYGLLPSPPDATTTLEELSANPPSTSNFYRMQRAFHVGLASSDGPLVLIRDENLDLGAIAEHTQVPLATFRFLGSPSRPTMRTREGERRPGR